MTKKTRSFVLVSAAILIAGLTTGLVASYMGLSIPILSKAAGPSEFQYVPAAAAVVGYADVRTIMDSQFRQRFRELEPDSHERDEFEQQTGLDIDHDIDSVVAAMMPVSEGPDPERGMLILARGRFQQGQIERVALEHGGRVETYQGVRLLRTPAEHAGSHEMAIGFVEADLVALGTYEALRGAIDAGRSGANIMSNNELMRQVTELDGNSAWAVGRFDAIGGGVALPRELQAQLPTLTWFSAAGHVNGGVSGVIKAEARDDEAAQNLLDMVRGLMALGRLQSGNNAGVRAMVDSLQLSGDGRVVSLAFSGSLSMAKWQASKATRRCGDVTTMTTEDSEIFSSPNR